MELLFIVILFRNEFDVILLTVDVVVFVEVRILFCEMLFVLIMTTCGRFNIGESIWVLIWLVVVVRFGVDMLVVGFRTVDNWDMLMIFFGWLVVWIMVGGLIWGVVVVVGVADVDVDEELVFIGFIMTYFLFDVNCWREEEEGVVFMFKLRDELSFVKSLAILGLFESCITVCWIFEILNMFKI